MTDRYSYYHLKFVTLCLGLYLFCHFLYLVSSAPETFSDIGIFKAQLSPIYEYFPRLITFFMSVEFLIVFVLGLAYLSFLIILGSENKWVFIGLCIGWTALLSGNLFVPKPSMLYIGWMLLCMAYLYPVKDKFKFILPKIIFITAWGLLAIGYALSGLDKMQSANWVNGQAVSLLLDNPLLRGNFLVDLLRQATFMHLPMTYISLVGEVLFLPLCFFSATRKYIWLVLLGAQLGMLFVVDFSDLTFGMLIFHLFVFDPRWVPQKISNPVIVFFDGVCGLCNLSVDMLIREDQSKKILFSPLQGEEIKKYVKEYDKNKMNTLLVWDDSTNLLLSKTSAWRFLALRLGGIWKVLAFVSYLIPIKICNFIYDIIAKNRYKIFGVKETCRIPSAEERELFLP